MAHPLAAETPGETAQHAAAASPRDVPAGLAASLAGGHLSIFNLGAAAADGAQFTVPQPTAETVLYQGVQQIAAGDTTRYMVTIAAADARVTPARFAATDPSGAALRTGTGLYVRDSRTVDVTGPADASVTVRLRSLATGEAVTVTAGAGQTVRADFAGPRTPTPDLARGRSTFPTSPRPTGMTDPALAVDGDPTTSWIPGAAGRRMVVDLGSARAIGAVFPTWSAGSGPAARIEASTDGLTFQQYAADTTVTARYVALVAATWLPGDGLTSLVVLPPGNGGVDEVRFPPVSGRYVRMYGVRAATQYGFSVWEMSVYGASGGNLAVGRPTSASSVDPDFPAGLATDGDAGTRWAVAVGQRSQPGWLMVDLGSVRSIDRVVLNWEAAYASHYRVEVSNDAQTWQTATRIPDPADV